MIRFWDTSALIQTFRRGERAHARATNLLYSKSVRPMTSMIVAVELVSVLVRSTRDRGLAGQAVDLLRGFEQVEFAEPHRDLAVRLSFTGGARGADTAIAAQALIVASAGAPLEFVTADEAQARLVETEGRARRLRVRLIRLPA